MIKNKIFDAIICTFVLIGIGGLAEACDTGRGYLLSIVFIVSGAVLEHLRTIEKKEPIPWNALRDRLRKRIVDIKINKVIIAETEGKTNDEKNNRFDSVNAVNPNA